MSDPTEAKQPPWGPLKALVIVLLWSDLGAQLGSGSVIFGKAHLMC